MVRVVDGVREAVLEGLSFPTLMAFAQDGSAFVTINGVGTTGSGELVEVVGLGRQVGR